MERMRDRAWENDIIDHTDILDQRQPEVGDKMRSWPDMVELTYVSDFRANPKTGKRDRLIAFKVIEVYSPEDSEITGEEVELLFGDMIDGCTYTFVDPDPEPNEESSLVKLQDLLDQIEKLKNEAEAESNEQAFNLLDRLEQTFAR